MKCRILTILFYVCLFGIATTAASQARDVTLQWDPCTDSTVTGYKVYYDSDSASAPFSGTGATQGASPFDAKNVTTAILNNLDPGKAYYFAVTAYNDAGTESTYSNVVSIAEATPPTVSITAPLTNTSVSGTVSVSASATDNVGVTSVEFYLNGVLKQTDTSTPYLYSLSTTALTSGTYTLVAKAYDAAGNVGQSSSVSVTVVNDVTAPTVSLTAPANNATLSGTATIVASASDNVGVSNVEFYRSGTLLYATNVAPYSYAWNTTSVANGSYSMTAKAYDNAGNVATSANVAVTVSNLVADTTAPAVSITAPVNNATVSGTVSVTASATDNVDVSRVEFYVNSVLQATDSAVPFSYSWNTALVDNGTYSTMAKAYDAAGNVGQSTYISVVVNNVITPPTGTITASFGNATGADYQGTIEDTYININTSVNASNPVLSTYTWPATTPANAILMKWNLSALPANAQIQSATLSLYMTASGGDVLYEMPVSGIINKMPVIAQCNGNTYDGTNAWTASSIPYGGIPLAQSDIDVAVDAPLVDTTTGYKNWNVTSIVKDWLVTPGNNRGLLLNSSNKASSDSKRVFASSEAVDAGQRPVLVVTYIVTPDTVVPTAAISNPLNSATVSGTVTVNASASDNVGVTRVEFFVNGVLQTTAASSPYSFSWNTAALVNGTYALTVTAYDAAGNIGQSSAVNVTVNNVVADTTLPATTITAPAANAAISGTVSITASASDNVGVTRVEFFVNGVLQTTAASSPYSFSWNTAALANGTYALTTKAYDAAGNIGQSSAVNVTVNNVVADTTLPATTITAPAANATVSGTVSITASASDNVGVTRVEFFVNGVLKGTDTTTPYSYSWNSKSVANGTYALTSKAYDAAGNVKQSAAVSIIVKNIVADTTAPTVAITSPAANSTVSGTVCVAVSASDNIGVTKVEYYVNGSLNRTVTTAPFGYCVATTAAYNGSYTMYAKAYDAAGNSRKSASVSYKIYNK